MRGQALTRMDPPCAQLTADWEPKCKSILEKLGRKFGVDKPVYWNPVDAKVLPDYYNVRGGKQEKHIALPDAWHYDYEFDPIKTRRGHRTSDLGGVMCKQVIKNPMFFGSIEQNLVKHKYNSASEFQADCQLSFNNCMLYNPVNDPFRKKGEEVREGGRRTREGCGRVAAQTLTDAPFCVTPRVCVSRPNKNSTGSGLSALGAWSARPRRQTRRRGASAPRLGWGGPSTSR